MHRSDPPPSLSPPATPDARRVTLIAHSVVNGMGVLSLALMHLYGSVPAEWAVPGILAICGVWGVATRKGPPSASPGLVGILATLSTLRPHF